MQYFCSYQSFVFCLEPAFSQLAKQTKYNYSINDDIVRSAACSIISVLQVHKACKHNYVDYIRLQYGRKQISVGNCYESRSL